MPNQERCTYIVEIMFLKLKIPGIGFNNSRKRVRYFYNWAKSGTPIKHNIHMFSSPHNVFFIIARVCKTTTASTIRSDLVADCIASSKLYKSGRQSSSSYKRTKICIEGLYAQGMEISKEGKTANAQEIPVLIKPPLTVHAFDRSSLKFNDFHAQVCTFLTN